MSTPSQEEARRCPQEEARRCPQEEVQCPQEKVRCPQEEKWCLQEETRCRLLEVHGVPLLQPIVEHWERIQRFQASPQDVLIVTYPKAGEDTRGRDTERRDTEGRPGKRSQSPLQSHDERDLLETHNQAAHLTHQYNSLLVSCLLVSSLLVSWSPGLLSPGLLVPSSPLS